MIPRILGTSFITAVIGLAGGWWLRGLADRYRAEVARDCKWDRDHA